MWDERIEGSSKAQLHRFMTCELNFAINQSALMGGVRIAAVIFTREPGTGCMTNGASG